MPMKNKNIFSNFSIILIILIDVLALVVSLELSTFIRTAIPYDILPKFDQDNMESYYWIIALILFIFFSEKIYFIRYDFWDDTKRVLQGLIVSFVIILTVLTFAKVTNDYSRSFLVLFFSLCAFIIPFFKRLGKSIVFKYNLFKIRVKIIASEEQYNIISKELKDNWYFGFKEVNKKYDMVIISSKKFETKKLQEEIKKYSKRTKDIYVIPYMDNIAFIGTSIVQYSNIRLSVIHIENRLLNYKNIFIKEFCEKIVVIMMLPLIAIVHIIISLLIKLDSSGPIRFKQKRYGKNGKEFSCYKYRTMYVNNEKILKDYLDKNPQEIEYYEIYHKYKNDPRITKIGKFLRSSSLDEFPQFYNILRGDMNLIGPRPYMLQEKEKIGKSHEDIILKVKPGLTGLWQVNGRNKLSFKQRKELDLWYIQNWSLWIDFVIFLKTIKVVLLKIGAK